MKISRKLLHKLSFCICNYSDYCDFWQFIFYKVR